jgi:PBP1b-binding outer membrane lipoprotein LpoB
MKKLSLLLLVVIAIMGLTACGNKAENTAKSFFKALETQDFDTAKKLATEDGQQLLTLIQSMSESAPEEQKAELTKKRYNLPRLNMKNTARITLTIKLPRSYKC